jgi:arylsulfatase A-like enzyme
MISVFAVVLLLHVLVFARALVLYPQLFAEFFYDRGGFWRWVQATLTDRVGLGPLNVLPAVALGVGLLLWLALILRAGSPVRRHPVKIAAVPAALGLVLLGLYFRPVADHNQGPNLLIIAADSVRPDRLSADGYFRPTSPALDRLAREGTFFDHAFSQLPRTFPAWVSLLTGEYPIHHGITSMFPSVADRQKDFQALPQLLAARGYATVALADYAGDIFPRIDLGFQQVDAPTFNLNSLAELRGLEIHTHLLPYIANSAGRRLFPTLKGFATLVDPALVERDARGWLRRLKGRDRFMLTIFMSCTHFPYSPPWPYYRAWTDPSYRGLSKYSKINKINADEQITAEDIRQINAIFDGAIRATDEAVGGILQALKDLGLSDRTVVVFTSDHGENLYEGDALQGHGDHLRYDYSLRTPLIIMAPGLKPAGRVTSRVRSIDLFPTLLELLDVPAPTRKTLPLPPGMAAVSLVPAMRGEPQPDLPVYSETGIWFIDRGPGFFQHKRLPYPDVTHICAFEEHYNNDIVVRDNWKDYIETAKHRMLLADNLKVIYCPTPRGIEWELYDLAADPGEKTNLADSRPEQLALMKTKLFAFLRTRPGWTIAGDFYLPAQAAP